MSNLNHAAIAADLFAKNANSEQAMRVVAFYYLTKFPQYAQEAFKAVGSFPGPAYCSAGSSDVSSSDTKEKFAGSLLYPISHVRAWASAYRLGDKVAAIKLCRANTGLGLKEAKDLCEYVATKDW